MDIYTGGSTLATSHFVSSLSGNLPSNPKPIFVSSNHLMIVGFSSDGGSNFQGFSARYYTSKLIFALLRQDYIMLCLYFKFLPRRGRMSLVRRRDETGHVKVFAKINTWRTHGPTIVKLGREIGDNQQMNPITKIIW